MKWTDGMRDEAARLYGEQFRVLGDTQFWARFETLRAEIHAKVEGGSR